MHTHTHMNLILHSPSLRKVTLSRDWNDMSKLDMQILEKSNSG